MGSRSLKPRRGSVVISVGQIADEFGWTRTWVFSEVEAGRFPGPINPQHHKRMWRWSRARVVGFVEAVVAVDGDPTPAQGIVRPESPGAAA